MKKNGEITHVDIETMSPSDKLRWPCPGDKPDLGAMSVHEPPKDGWDKVDGAPKEPEILDTWDMAKPK